ncbi:MAG: hypothetical protein P8X69_10750, partial [Maritimibacter sp.]
MNIDSQIAALAGCIGAGKVEGGQRAAISFLGIFAINRQTFIFGQKRRIGRIIGGAGGVFESSQKITELQA